MSMKKTLIVCLLSGIFIFLLGIVSPLTFKAEAKNNECTTIQSGELISSAGDVITTGYDEWGYNYQAHLFNGTYCDAYRNADWCQAWAEDNLTMKWNDAWLSNKDCDDDELLDRHDGFDSYIGSGAWLTNHMSGTYVDNNGVQQKWTYFVKIIAAPSDAKLVDGEWFTADEDLIGYEIWGEFAIVQEIYNDTGTGDHGILYKGEAPLGFGFYRP